MTKSRDLANAATALNAVTAAELGFVDGVTSAIQTQIDTKLATATAATTYVPNSLADAKGDLFVATADNTVTRLPVGNSGEQIVADSSTATGLKWAVPAGGGKVLQVINATTSTVVTNSTSTYADTTLTATITPTLSTSKILIIALLNVQKGDANVYVQTRLLRGATVLTNVATQTGFNNSTAIQNVGTDGVTYLDSPATTSATTYKMQIASATNVASVTAQGGSSTSSITLMEIGA